MLSLTCKKAPLPNYLQNEFYSQIKVVKQMYLIIHELQNFLGMLKGKRVDNKERQSLFPEFEKSSLQIIIILPKKLKQLPFDEKNPHSFSTIILPSM